MQVQKPQRYVRTCGSCDLATLRISLNLSFNGINLGKFRHICSLRL